MQETTAVADVATTTAATATQTTDWWGLLLYCLIIFAIIYFFMVRPNKKRMAEYKKCWIRYRWAIAYWRLVFMEQSKR